MPVLELNVDVLEARYSRLRVPDQRGERQLLASIEEHGQRDPITVVAEGEGRFVVIDGHARVRALKRLRRDVVKALVLDMGPAEALATAYRQGLARGYNAIEEGLLVYELHRVWKWNLGTAAASMGRSRGWASRRLGLVEAMPDTVLEGVRCGKLGAWSAMKHLLPLARANGPACERLAEKIMEAGLSSRQVGLVCEHFAKSGVKVGGRILEDPARFLKALEASGKGPLEPGLSEAESRAFKQLELIGNVALGLTRGLPQVLGYDAGEVGRAKLWSAWERSAKRWALLEETAAALKAAAHCYQSREGTVPPSGTEDKVVEEVNSDQSGTTDGCIDPARAGPQQPQDRPGPGPGAQCGPGDHRQRASGCGGAAEQASPAGALC